MTTIQDIITAFIELVRNQLIPIAFGLAVIAFFWGLARYVYNNGSEDAQKNGKFIMVWGIIVMFIMAMLWGIIAFLQSDLGVDSETLMPLGGEDPFGPGHIEVN